MIYIDTSAIFATFDQDDTHHEKAAQTWIDLIKQNASLVCNNYVLLETIALLQNRLGMPAVKDFLQIEPVLNVVWIDSTQHRPALISLITANRRQLSLVDCTSFETMRRLGIRTAFTFDLRFSEQGFECVPALP